MNIYKTEIGTINDDFIHNWLTLKVILKDGSVMLFKYSKTQDKFYSFWYDTDTFETHLKDVSKETSLILEAEMDNPKTIRNT